VWSRNWMPGVRTMELAKTKDLRIEWWPVSRLIPYDKNPRKISDAAVSKVADSIHRYGWRQPIVVDPQDVIIIGHARRLAALKMGLDEVPVHVANLTPNEARLLRLADNRSGEEAAWDMKLLGAELSDLSAGGIDLGGSGFDGSELDRLLRPDTSAADEVLVPPEDPVSRPGDLWLLGKHRVICGDCTSPEVVERLLAGGKPRLMVTDPPYGIELDSEWRDRAGLNGCGPAQPSYMKKKRTTGHIETSISGDTRADWSEAFALVPSLEVAYVFHASKFTAEVLAGLLKIGFVHHQQIIWSKGKAALTRTHYWFSHEPVWYVRKPNAAWYGKAGENLTVWDSPSPKMIFGGSKEEKFDHPTQKPVELMRRSIVNHTKAGELVYEPFLGSGTTLAAAELTGRVCFGSEISPAYVDVVIQRWQNLSSSIACLESGETFNSVAAERKKGTQHEGTKA